MTSFTIHSTKTHFTKTTTKRLALLSLFFMLMGLRPQVLYAIPRGDASMGAERAVLLRTPANIPSKIRVVGELTSSTETNGEQVLNLKENQTGKTYRLGGNDETAKQYFKNGTTKVAIEGTVSGESTLNVQTTEAF